MTPARTTPTRPATPAPSRITPPTTTASDHGHDDHAHGEEPLGPIDVARLGRRVLGVVIGLVDRGLLRARDGSPRLTVAPALPAAAVPSEQPDDVPVGVDVDLLAARSRRQPRHRPHLAAERRDEPGARRTGGPRGSGR